MSALTLGDLSPVQQTYLGVLSLGLVSADQAGDGRFRMEYVCAISHALVQGLPRETYTAEEHHANEAFRGELRHAIIDLDRKGVIGIGPPQDLVILRPSAPDPDAAYGDVDVNRHPPIFDKYLSQRCMDVLLACAEVHRYLMDLYADSGDVWRELYKQGYGDYR
jgi:hypothetical protein